MKTSKTLADHSALRLTTLCLLYVAQGIPFGFVTIGLQSYLLENGFNRNQTGELLAWISLPAALKFVWGPIMDRFSFRAMGRRRSWILLAQGCLVLTLLVFACVPGVAKFDPRLLAAMILLTHLFAAMQDVAVDSLAIDLLPKKEQGRVASLMYGCSYLGTFLGGSIVGGLLFQFGIQAAFLLEAILLGAIMIAPLVLCERQGEKRFPWSSGKSMTPKEMEGASSFRQLLSQAAQAFSRRQAIAFAVFAVLVLAGGNAVSVIRSDYLINARGWDGEVHKNVMSYGVWFGFAGCLVGAASGRLDSRLRVAMASFTLAGFWCWFAASPVGTFDQDQRMTLSVFVFGEAFIRAYLNVSMFAMFMGIADKRVAATQFSAYMALLNVSNGAGHKFAGPIGDFFGVFWSHLALAGFQILILPILLIGAPKRKSEL